MSLFNRFKKSNSVENNVAQEKSDKDKTFIFFDVETPNNKNDRICGCGVCVTSNGDVVFKKDYLVNPETYFYNINVKIHGISEESVENAPTFPMVWNEVKQYFCNGNIVVCHNANFDLSVLEKTLRHYDLLDDFDSVNYLCTLKKAQQVLPPDNGYKLQIVCDALGVCNIQPHNALSDTMATLDVFRHIDKQYGWKDCDVYKYAFTHDMNNMPSVSFVYHSSKTQALIKLKELLERISEDGVVSDIELVELINWMSGLDESIIKDYPFDVIIKKLYDVVEDGVITREENKELIDLFNEVFAPKCESHDCGGNMQVKGKKFCITGDSKYPRPQIKKAIEDLGGMVTSGVSGKTDYVIKGELGSADYSLGNVGNKLMRAIELQQEGKPIKIVSILDCKEICDEIEKQ